MGGQNKGLKGGLLEFQNTILEETHDPTSSELVVISRGLGLRALVCRLLQLYESPNCLVLLVNARQEEELGIGEQLGLLGCRDPGLRIVGYEMPKKERQGMYKKGGIISVTSQILVVDMLLSDMPTELITGILVLHAERVTASSLEAFVVRLYREKNPKGFLKAFSDQPEYITSGMSPLKNVMKELHLRKVHIYPRFHETIKQSLERRKADVVELHQPMTDLMADIHHSIVQCMSITLSELKRSNTMLDLDDLTVENSYFRAFDSLVRRQLDPVWHKVGPKTKQLVGDLTTLRNLLDFLLTYDAFDFHSYLETIIQANTISPVTGRTRQHKSPWLFTDAANIIFTSAKKRCYIQTAPKQGQSVNKPIDIDAGDDDEWDALDEVEGLSGRARNEKQKKWIPDNIEPVLEEQPKWGLLADILLEIEDEMIKRPMPPSSPGTNAVLVMVGSSKVGNDIREYLSKIPDEAPSGSEGRGRNMMEYRLRRYLRWKAAMSRKAKEGSPNKKKANEDRGPSEALKMKDKILQNRAANRRRLRGGAPVPASERGSTPSVAVTTNEKGKAIGGDGMLEERLYTEAGDFADFLESTVEPGTSAFAPIEITDDMIIDLDVGEVAVGFDIHYGILPPEQLVIIRSYADDADDVMLSEIKPRYIVMYEPSLEFIRRIEVYRSSNPGLGVRVYFMMYHLSCEEHKYLAGLRKEKESFERLIKERAIMVLPLYEDRSLRSADPFQGRRGLGLSTRQAGGSSQVPATAPQIVVDMREFRSTLPSLLHASHVLVIPATLIVGDYILSPDICVERKSIPDLMSSFNSGRLYTQCELMSVHYKNPILLIEFEEHKAFSLEAVADVKLQSQKFKSASSKYSKQTAGTGAGDAEDSPKASVQAKLVLLALTFPRLRIIWSSSPYASSEIFHSLKLNQSEPDPKKALLVGTDETGDPEDPNSASKNAEGEGVNTAAEDLLRTFPGITAKNVRYVMRRVNSVRALCEMKMSEVQELLGNEPGKACYEFLHRKK